MSRFTKKSSYKLFPLVVLFFIFLGCSSSKTFIDEKLLHQSPEFGNENFSGTTIYLTPLLTYQGFDTNSSIGVMRQIGILTEARKDLKIKDIRQFINDFNKTHNGATLNRFFTNISQGNVLPVQTCDTVWHAFEGKYLIIIKQNSAASIKSFDNRIKKRIRLEAEIWDITNQETVWRYSVSAYTVDKKVSDENLVWQAILSVYQKIPSFVPALNETVW